MADNIGSLLQRVSASSVQEIDRLMAENEEWMADNLEKISSPGADENWYGDAILAQQGKYTLGCHGADVAMQSTAIPTKIQQLFDDAGSMGGLLQTATPRGQIVRFLHKHKVDVH